MYVTRLGWMNDLDVTLNSKETLDWGPLQVLLLPEPDSHLSADQLVLYTRHQVNGVFMEGMSLHSIAIC